MSTQNKRPSKQVAVVVPLSLRSQFSSDEEISLRHLNHFLGRYDRYLVAPKSLDIDLPGFGIKRFSDKFFGSAVAHGRLALSRRFYEAFSDYEYILIYHLDALVFSDQLAQWCAADLDFIGPPWIPCEDSPWVKEPRVGNGGLCLRRVQSFLKVIDSQEYQVDPTEYWNSFRAQTPNYLQYLLLPKKYLKRVRFFNCARWEASRWYANYQRHRNNEEFFWVNRGAHYYPQFKVAPFEEGLQFAFEVAPRKCFDLNGSKLPFGCHAWPKYDRDFWTPYLLK
jgi:Protein of unknown function (DUF5672)